MRRVLLALVLMLAGTGVATADEITVALTDSTPNFSMRREDGTTTGINVELAALLCSRMKLHCRFKPMPLADLLQHIKDGKAQIAFANLVKTPERENTMLFSKPYWRSSTAFVGPGRLAGTPMESLVKDRTVAVQEGSRQAKWLQSRFDGQTSILTLPTIAQVTEALDNGQADLALAPMMTLYPFLLTPAGGRFGFVSAPIDAGWPVHVVVSKNRPDLLERLDDALDGAQRDGSLGRIARSYVPFDIF